MNTKARGALAIVLSVAVVGLLAGPLSNNGAPAQAQDEPVSRNLISVNGFGRVFVRPDMAELSLGVFAEAQTAREAYDEAAQAMARVIEALKSGGIDESDIQTGVLALNPVYNYNGRQPQLRGYEVNNVVRANITDLDRLPALLDSAVGAGATRIDGVNFRVLDETAVQAEAREAAVADARAKAEALAKAAGVSLGDVVAISEQSYMPPVYGRTDLLMAEDAGMPVLPGQNLIEIQVQVSFAIAP